MKITKEFKQKAIDLIQKNASYIKELQEEYKQALNTLDDIVTKKEAIQKSILKCKAFYEDAELLEQDERPERITDGNNSYMMSSADFDIYLNWCYAEYKKANIDDARGKEYLPEARIKEKVKMIEDEIISFQSAIMRNSNMISLENASKLLTVMKYKESAINLFMSLA